jgi:hypothetical protein
MPFVIDQAMKKYSGSHDLYIAQHSYLRAQRSTAALLSINVGHVDLDVYKSAWLGHSTDKIIAAVLKKLDAWQIPHPSYIVDSGRGLQAKWIFDAPVPPAAMPRWQSAHRYLVKEILFDFEADEKAILPTQIMRLVGSHNQANGRQVSVCWVGSGDILKPTLHNFDTWCAAVLPYTREEVKEFRARMAQYNAWDTENAQNLRLLADDEKASSRSKARKSSWEQVAKAIGVEPGKLALMDDLVAGEIWSRRIDVMRRLQAIRGYTSGTPEKERHSWIWIAANAMAWVNRRQAEPLRKDVIAWAKEFVPTYTAAEALSAATSVIRRSGEAQGWNTGLYRMSEPRFRAELRITETELDQIKAAATPARKAVREGAMGFEPIRGKAYEAYKAEVTHRRRLAGVRSAQVRSTTHTEEKRSEARLMASKGMSTRQIGEAIGVSHMTVARWIAL